MNGISFLPARDKGAEKSMAVKIVFSLSTATYGRRDIGQFSVLPNGPFKEKKGVNSPDCMQFLRTGKVAARSTFCFLRRPHFHRERETRFSKCPQSIVGRTTSHFGRPKKELPIEESLSFSFKWAFVLPLNLSSIRHPNDPTQSLVDGETTLKSAPFHRQRPNCRIPHHSPIFAKPLRSNLPPPSLLCIMRESLSKGLMLQFAKKPLPTLFFLSRATLEKPFHSNFSPRLKGGRKSEISSFPFFLAFSPKGPCFFSTPFLPPPSRRNRQKSRAEGGRERERNAILFPASSSSSRLDQP